MPLYKDRMALFAKTEATYGTDSTPTAALNGILVRNVKPTPLKVESDERELITGAFGANQKLVAGTYAMLDFDVEIAGSGTAGTAPKWGTLMLGCNFSETVTAGTKVVYAPISDQAGSLSLYFNLGGLQQRLLGARGTVKKSFTKMKAPLFSFSFWGLVDDAPLTDTPLVMPTLGGFQTPLPVNKKNTPVFSLHGYSAITSSLDIDMANQLVYRNLIGHESIQITDRAPAGSALFEMTSVAAKDWLSAIKNNATGPLALTHGTTAGNIVKVLAPKVSLGEPDYSDEDRIVMLKTGLTFLPNAGNDELTIEVS